MDFEKAQILDCWFLTDLSNFLEDLDLDDFTVIEQNKIDELIKGIDKARWFEQTVYDVFAHRLGPNEWQECVNEIRNL